MLAITIEENCNICFEKFTNDKLNICKNKKCTFKMCLNCSNKYYENNQKCPHCNIQVINKENRKSYKNIKFIIKILAIDIIAYFIGFSVTKQSSFAFIIPNMVVGVGIMYFLGFLIYLFLRYFNIDIMLIIILILC
tara:strand:- start:22 stop:429 length:408 start_codon:yes stop_codon:yes gene_type:complete